MAALADLPAVLSAEVHGEWKPVIVRSTHKRTVDDLNEVVATITGEENAVRVPGIAPGGAVRLSNSARAALPVELLRASAQSQARSAVVWW